MIELRLRSAGTYVLRGLSKRKVGDIGGANADFQAAEKLVQELAQVVEMPK